jgi:uncharacterized coiled-coil protein SlyX
MEVHFCDICNESVPQRDLDQGRAFLRKGRVVCAACDLSMGGEQGAGSAGDDSVLAGAETALGTDAPAAVPAGGTGHHAAHGAPAGSGLAMVLAAMAILLTASVAVLLFERLNEAGLSTRGELKGIRGEVRAELDGVRDDLVADQRARSEELRRVSTEIATAAARAEERDKSASAGAIKLSADVAELVKRIDQTAALAERVAAQDRRAEELSATIAEMRGDIGLIAEKVLELEQRPVAVAPAAAPGPVAPAVAQPAWMAFTADLKSPSSGARWAAVTALGDTKDPAVIPYLLPMFADSDLFVRMATARVLGDLASMEPIPALIDALEDEEPSVREAAAISLRKLSGEAFGFDPSGNLAERSKKVKAWRDWWKRKGSSA